MRSVTKEIFIVLLIAASVQSQPVKGEESGQDQNQEGSASAQAPVQDVETSNSSVISESMKGNESEQFQNQEEYFQHENSTPTVRSLEAEQDQDRARVGSVTELNKAETDLGDEAPTTRDRDKVTEPTTKEGNDDGEVEIDGNDVKNVTATAKHSKEIHSDDSMNGDGDDYSIDDENMASNEESPVPEVEEILEDEVDETVETADAVNSNHFTSSIIFVIVVAVIVIVVSVIGCCCICAKRKQKKSYEMAMKEREPMLN